MRRLGTDGSKNELSRIDNETESNRRSQSFPPRFIIKIHNRAWLVVVWFAVRGLATIVDFGANVMETIQI